MPASPSSASLPAGTRLAHYEIGGLIGAGGMGHVYRARDLKLQRDVALKLLPGDVADDRERRQRFEREARAVAALNHPGIVTIHSVDEVDGRVFLTMELVHGRPLTDLIPRGGLPIDRLLALAVPLTDAVSAAHARGITHRDLKPANVMVTVDGHVKVLDFGLAKPSDLADGTEATVTQSPDVITGQGRILGTIAYMSPEQAEGKPVDARSDVFSLGVLLYEMATGERPFKGDSSVSTLAAIIRDTPRPASEVNGALPRELWRVIRRALAKDPERRHQGAKDLRNELEEVRKDLESGELAAPITPPGVPAASRARPPSSADALPAATVPPATTTSATVVSPAGRSWTPRWAVAASVLGVVAIAAALLRWWPAGGAASPPDATASRVTVESVVSLTSEDGLELFPSLSPDGRWVIYTASEHGAGQTDIFLRGVGGQTAINLTKDSAVNDTQPAFSPDGERIAFASAREGGGIFVMGRTGESVRRVSTFGFNPSWSPDGRTLAFATEPVNQPYGRATRSSLWTVPLAGGEPKRLTEVQDAMQPAWSPDGQRLVYWGLLGDSVQRDLWTVAASGGPPVRLTDDRAVDWSPIWAPDGRHVYYSSDRSGNLNLWRIGISLATGAPQGEPEAITLPRQGVAHFSLAGGGSLLAAASFATQSNIELLTLDLAAGKITGRRRVTNVSEGTSGPSISPDGAWIAFWRNTNGQEDIWVVKRDGSGLRQVTNDAARDRNPQFTPDGQLLFYSDRAGRYQVWRMGLDGGDLRQVTDYPGVVISPQLTRDGSRAVANLPLARHNIFFDPRVDAGAQQIERLPPFPGQPGVFTAGSWSPDGRVIAGNAVRAGGGIFTYDIARREFRELVPQGLNPIWLPDGRHLVFRSGGGAAGEGFVGTHVNVLETTTGKVRQVFATEREAIEGLDVSLDAREIAAVIINRQADIVLAKLSTR